MNFNHIEAQKFACMESFNPGVRRYCIFSRLAKSMREEGVCTLQLIYPRWSAGKSSVAGARLDHTRNNIALHITMLIAVADAAAPNRLTVLQCVLCLLGVLAGSQCRPTGSRATRTTPTRSAFNCTRLEHGWSRSNRRLRTINCSLPCCSDLPPRHIATYCGDYHTSISGCGASQDWKRAW